MKQLDFGEIADFRNGLNFSKASHGKGCLIIGVSDFRDRMTPDDNSLEEINVTGIVGEEDYVSKGDILFVRSNGNKRLVGRSLFIDKDIKAVFSGFCIRARLKSALFDPKFCFYFTKTNTFRSFISTSGGTNIQNLNQAILAHVKLPHLSIKEQNKIVKVLSDIDAKIDLNNKINSELEAMAKLIYDYWFVQFDFPNAKGKPYKTSGGKMVWNEELKREIPEGWEAGSLSDLGEIIGGSTPSRDVEEYFTAIGTPWITPKDLSANTGNKFITRGELDVTDKGLKSASLTVMPSGTVLLSSRAPIGYLAIAREDVTTNQGFKSFVPSKGFPTEYVYYSIKNMIPAIEKNATGSTFKEVSGSVLKSIPVHLPDKEIINKYTSLVSNIFSKQNLLELESQKLSELRDWLLPMLMNGQIRIRDADVNRAIKQPVGEVCFKPVNPYFYQTQVVAAIVNASKKNNIKHGEMTLAKYSYLLEKIYKVPTLFNYDRWHLGPYPKEMKKVVNNKKFFKIQNNEVSVVPQKKEYDFEFQQQVEDAVTELASIFNQYKGKERSHQTELLATVCKVVEDIQSTDLKAVRESMKKWPIDLKTSKFKNKAEKFGEEETNSVLKFISSKHWDKLLVETKYI